MKLTMVSVYSHGIKVTDFVNLPVSPDGKVRITQHQVFDIFYRQTGIWIGRGETYSIGV